MSPSFHAVPVAPVPAALPLHPVDGPQAWYGPKLAKRPAEWTYVLSRDERSELLAAIAHVESLGDDVVDITAEAFALPTLGAMLRGMRKELLHGRGFVLLRGFPVEELTPLQRGIQRQAAGVRPAPSRGGSGSTSRGRCGCWCRRSTGAMSMRPRVRPGR